MDYLVAHVVNVHAEPEVLYEVASQAQSGDWYTNDGRRVWPFFKQPLSAPPIWPLGWLEHLHAEAIKFACANKVAEPKTGSALLASLGLLKPSEPLKRRI